MTTSALVVKINHANRFKVSRDEWIQSKVECTKIGATWEHTTITNVMQHIEGQS